MGLRSWFSEYQDYRAYQRLSKKDASIGGLHIQPWQQGRPYAPATNYNALIKKYQSYVYACASKNAISCAQVPLRLYSTRNGTKTKSRFPVRKLSDELKSYLYKSPTVYQKAAAASEVEEVLEHPFLDLLKNVNEFSNQFDLLEGMFLYLELTGNAYWHIVVESLGTPAEIWQLLPQHMKIIPSREKFIEAFEYEPVSPLKTRFEPEQILHFKYPNPKSTIYGFGPLQAAVIAADLGVEMNTYETMKFKNGALLDMALVLPAETGEPSPSEMTRMEKKWQQKHRGVKNAGRLPILSGGAKLETIGLKPKEMAFLQGRKASLNEVAAIFGVPMSKLTSENVNRANAEAGDYSYMKDTILPRLRKVEQKINERLLPKYDASLFCAFDNPVPQDKEYRLKEIDSKLKNGYTSINEERLKDGQGPVGWGEVPILPAGMTPLGTEAEEVLTEPVKIIKASAKFPPLEHPTNFVNEPMVQAVADYFGEVRDAVIAALEREYVVIQRYHTAKTPADDFVSGWFNEGIWAKRLEGTLEPFMAATMSSAATRTMSSLPTELAFDYGHPSVLLAAENHIGRIREMTATTTKKIRSAVAMGIDAGEGAEAIRRRLEDEFEGMQRNQARLIARTETIWAHNEGARQAYIQSGVVKKMEWVSSGDQRSCEFCLSMDGEIVGVQDSFFDKGGSHTGSRGGVLNFEYEEINHPPLHCNCRCCIVPVIEGI